MAEDGAPPEAACGPTRFPRGEVTTGHDLDPILTHPQVRRLYETYAASVLDYVALADGRKLRCLNIVDDCARECLAIEVDTSLTGRRVVAVLQRLAETRGLLLSISVDHGPEFEGQAPDAWALESGVQLAFIRRGVMGSRACTRPSLRA